MTDEEMWRIVHDWRIAVRRGLAKPILCRKDETEMTPRMGRGGTPILYCMTCRLKTYPGIKMLDGMKNRSVS